MKARNCTAALVVHLEISKQLVVQGKSAVEAGSIPLTMLSLQLLQQSLDMMTHACLPLNESLEVSTKDPVKRVRDWIGDAKVSESFEKRWRKKVKWVK